MAPLGEKSHTGEKFPENHTVENILTKVTPRHILTLVVKPGVESLGLPTATLVFNAVEAIIVSTQVFYQTSIDLGMVRYLGPIFGSGLWVPSRGLIYGSDL